ncbi:MAG: hypothetical protein WCJ45_09535 [bacterium]
MKHTSITVLLLTIVLAGCVSKSNFSLTFDQFTMKFYDNKKIYSDML